MFPFDWLTDRPSPAPPKPLAARLRVEALEGRDTPSSYASTTTLSSSANPATAGQPVILTATVDVQGYPFAPPAGSVAFFDGATRLGSADVGSGGKASIRVGNLSVGSHNLRASYGGASYHTGYVGDPDNTYGSSEGTLTLTVKAPAPVANVANATSATPTSGGSSAGAASKAASSGGIVAVGGDRDSTVRVFRADGSPLFTLTAFDPSFTGGVRVAVGDVNGDGTPDVIAAAGPGGAPLVKVFSGTDGSLLTSFLAYEGGFTGGVYVAAGDFNGDGHADVVTSADQGGGPRVRVFSGADGSVMADFLGIDDASFRGGARVAVGDVNGDGTPDLVVGAGFGGGPRVAIFDGKSIAPGQTPRKLVGDFFVFEPTLRNGVFLGAGDLNGDGSADLIFGGGPGGGPRVLALDGHDLIASGRRTELANFFAGDPNLRDGVRVAGADLNGDGSDEILAGPGGAGTDGAYDRQGNPAGNFGQLPGGSVAGKG